MKITCVVDNSVKRSSPFWGEHGVSFLIETGGKRILFDTGQSGIVLLHNLEELRTKPEELDAIALSHAHYDHTGGLEALLEQAAGLPVFAHPDLFRERFSRHGERIDSIGLSLTREALAEQAELHLSAEPIEIASGVWTTGEIAPRPEPDGRSARHLVRADGGWAPDPYNDDMALVLETEQGLVVICGCCHAGLLNTVAHVRRTFRDEIIAIVGGFHLADADEAQLKHTIEVLKSYGSPRLYPNHCTGERAYTALAMAFGERVAPCPVGTVLSF